MEKLTRSQVISRSDALSAKAPADPKYQDILESYRLLQSLEVPCLILRALDGWQLIYWPDVQKRTGDVVQNASTEGKMMAYGFDLPDHTEMEVDIDEVIALFETAHEHYLEREGLTCE